MFLVLSSTLFISPPDLYLRQIYTPPSPMPLPPFPFLPRTLCGRNQGPRRRPWPLRPGRSILPETVVRFTDLRAMGPFQKHFFWFQRGRNDITLGPVAYVFEPAWPVWWGVEASGLASLDSEEKWLVPALISVPHLNILAVRAEVFSFLLYLRTLHQFLTRSLEGGLVQPWFFEGGFRPWQQFDIRQSWNTLRLRCLDLWPCKA